MATTGRVFVEQVVDCMRNLSLGDKRYLISETTKAIHDDLNRDSVTACARDFEKAKRVIEEAEPRLEHGMLYNGERTRLYSNCRAIIDYYLAIEKAYPVMVISGVTGRAYGTIQSAVSKVRDMLSMPRQYSSECSLYHMFKYYMEHER